MGIITHPFLQLLQPEQVQSSLLAIPVPAHVELPHHLPHLFHGQCHNRAHDGAKGWSPRPPLRHYQATASTVHIVLAIAASVLDQIRDNQ